MSCRAAANASAAVSLTPHAVVVVVPCRNMKNIKALGSTGIYAWTTLISCFICIPGALYFEGPTLRAGMDAAITKVRRSVLPDAAPEAPRKQSTSSQLHEAVAIGVGVLHRNPAQ